MTIQKAIEIIERKSSIPEEGESFKDISEAFDIAVDALKEIQKYRVLGTVKFLTDMKSYYANTLSDLRQYQKIGTVEECKEARERRWILCCEQLPKGHIDVLVSFSDHDSVIAWYSEVNKCWKNSSTGNVITAKVIAWQQLPEPYQERSRS